MTSHNAAKITMDFMSPIWFTISMGFSDRKFLNETYQNKLLFKKPLNPNSFSKYANLQYFGKLFEYKGLKCNLVCLPFANFESV